MGKVFTSKDIEVGNIISGTDDIKILANEYRRIVEVTQILGETFVKYEQLVPSANGEIRQVLKKNFIAWARDVYPQATDEKILEQGWRYKRIVYSEYFDVLRIHGGRVTIQYVKGNDVPKTLEIWELCSYAFEKYEKTPNKIC